LRRIEQVEKTERKEKIDGTYGRTGRRPDAGAADLPDDVAHAAAPLLRRGQIRVGEDFSSPQDQPAAQAAEPAPAPAASEPDYVNELERLAQLRDQGILTNDEFEAKKKQILGI
jgi:hypothetical protein